MREVGAKPFAFADEAAFERAYRDRLERFERPANARAFFLAMAPLFAMMNDGHVSILLGHEYDAWRDAKGRGSTRSRERPPKSSRRFCASGSTRDGERTSYVVSATMPNGERRTTVVRTTTSDEVGRALDRAPKQSEANYTFSSVAGGSVGYIDYRHCVDKSAFSRFLAQTFTGIKANPVAGIVIDIRRNGGGDSDVNDAVDRILRRSIG